MWAVALVAAALGIAAIAAFSGPARAHGAELAVSKSVSPKVVAVGEKQTFTITITNRGDRRATNLTMTDPLPGAVRFIRASTSRHVPGSCGLRPERTVVCDLGSLRPGNTVTVKIFIRTVRAGSYTNRAFVSFGAAGAFGSDASGSRDAAAFRIVRER